MDGETPRVRALLAIAGIVFLAGGLVHAVLDPTPGDRWLRALAAAALLTSVCVPILYATVVAPALTRARRLREAAELQRASTLAEARRLMNVDPLTGLLNRRGIEVRITELLDARVPFSLAMADLDHFKQLNDAHGHLTGDRALRLFAHTLAASIRPGDEAARFGGEEFVVLLPGADTSAATAVLERVRSALRRSLADADVPPFTSSFGVATHPKDATAEEVLSCADRALYAAKHAGRDRVVVFSAGLDRSPTARGAVSEPSTAEPSAAHPRAVPAGADGAE